MIVCEPGKEGGREEALGEKALVKEGGKRPTYAMYASCLIVNLYPLVLGGGGGRKVWREDNIAAYTNSHFVVVTVLPWQQVVMRLVHTGKDTYMR